MVRIVLALLVPLTLGGCFSYTDTTPPPPSHTTVVVPPGSAVTCPDGGAPPC
ncbi:MAG TPA: hypothetical protein VMU81_30625 [Acetobacteraceae bacterium]|nr:hypothetical protein [Acetobacteraceae bacterium]